MASSYWPTKGDLTFESEGFLIAAQDQALNTRAVRQVYSGSANAQCRLCNTQAETVEHLISGCSQLDGTKYKLRHDNVARYIHWCLCGKHSFERVSNWWKHCPDSVIENDSVEILWDFNIFVDHFISARKPDIVVINNEAATISLIDVAVPADKHISAKEEEKLMKYQDLRIELERLWKKKTTMIPIVISSLNVYLLQKTALLGTATTLWKVLQLSGCG